MPTPGLDTAAHRSDGWLKTIHLLELGEWLKRKGKTEVGTMVSHPEQQGGQTWGSQNQIEEPGVPEKEKSVSSFGNT